MPKPGNGFLLIAGIIIFCIGFTLQGVWATIAFIVAGICVALFLLTSFGIVPFL